jgi:hypothetical protein
LVCSSLSVCNPPWKFMGNLKSSFRFVCHSVIPEIGQYFNLHRQQQLMWASFSFMFCFLFNKCHETTIKNLKFQLSSHEWSLYYISFLSPLMQIGLEGWIKQWPTTNLSLKFNFLKECVWQWLNSRQLVNEPHVKNQLSQAFMHLDNWHMNEFILYL